MVQVEPSIAAQVFQNLPCIHIKRAQYKKIQKREQSKQLFPLQNNTMKQVNVLAEEVKLKIVWLACYLREARQSK